MIHALVIAEKNINTAACVVEPSSAICEPGYSENALRAFGILTEPNPPILSKVPIAITQQEAGRIAAGALTIGDEAFQQAEQLVRDGEMEQAIAAFVRVRMECPSSWIHRVFKARIETLKAKSRAA